MLPTSYNDSVKRRGCITVLKEKVSNVIRIILADSNSRNLLGFLVINLTFAFVELFYGVWTNSLGLISDSFHMFFDCTGNSKQYRSSIELCSENYLNIHPCIACEFNNKGSLNDARNDLLILLIGLLAGLVASVITKWRSNDKYSFGYVRAEILAGFINGLFLLFISFFILSEAVERLVEPPEVKHDLLLLVAILGKLLKLKRIC